MPVAAVPGLAASVMEQGGAVQTLEATGCVMVTLPLVGSVLNVPVAVPATERLGVKV